MEFTFVDKNHDPKFKACKHVNPYHDAIYVVDIGACAVRKILSSSRLSTAASSALTRFPQNASRVSFIYVTKAETYTKTRVALACSPQSRKSHDALWTRNKSNPSCPWLSEKGTLPEETLGVTQTRETNW